MWNDVGISADVDVDYGGTMVKMVTMVSATRKKNAAVATITPNIK